MFFTLVQIIYWLALATWFGAVLFVAVAAPVIFRTVRESNPILPTVLSVNLEHQHSSLLAGTIVGEILNVLRRVEIVCAGALLVAMVGQWIYIFQRGPTFQDVSMLAGILRSALYLAAVALLLYDWLLLWPRIWRLRQEYIDNADTPEIANPAKEQFDSFHRHSVSLMGILLLLLLGMIVFGAHISAATPL